MRFHHPAVPIVLVAMLIDSIGFGIVIPVLPSLIVELGQLTLADATRVGGHLLMGYAIAQFFAGPVMGSLGDRFGRRPVILASMLAFSADYALMAFAPTLGWLYAGRIVAGLTGALYAPANATLADVTPPERRGATFGMMGAAFGTGFILGPALGGLLAMLGPRAPFLAAAALALANATWIAARLPETLPPARRRPFSWAEANIFGAFRPLLQAGKGVRALLLAAFAWQLAHMVYPATWAFWSELAMGWDERAIGWSLATSGLVMAAAQMGLTGRAIARYGEQRTVVMGALAGVLVFAGFAFATRGWQVYLLLIAGGGQALVYPSINALLSRMTEADRQGALQGGMSSIASVAAIIGPLTLTQALAWGAERGMPGTAFALAAMLAALTLALMLFGVLPRLRQD